MKKAAEYSTRKQLVTMLKKQGSLSVNEMAKQLGITEMAVRRHLNTLERDALLESVLVRQAMGRPVRMYSLTGLADELFPKNYHVLTLDLLKELEEAVDEDPVGNLFERRKDRLLRKYKARMEGKNLKQRVVEMTEIQNEQGYMAAWEIHEDGGFVIREFNCPISQVAQQYGQACRCELDLIRTLLEAEVKRKECLVNGGNKCMYLVSNKI
ncbi:helix-turn-helix transcriptional regulator [Ferviditalea candida]|uniref:Metalloregulator ArsR/SmtB family transcription factor n=1 Tax=Ferviditalea candida TaxID=3108399 RepID=A0ABU5ZGR8_9BACL|nr:metalloregulator ArsR/SmtB family transcription factor [Paenibacillaceae bacterium T2]